VSTSSLINARVTGAWAASAPGQLQVWPCCAFGETRVLAGRVHGEELDLYKTVKNLATRGRIKSPESLGLFMGHTQAWHFCVLCADSAQQIVERDGVGGSHCQPTFAAFFGEATVTPSVSGNHVEFFPLALLSLSALVMISPSYSHESSCRHVRGPPDGQ
jgi:hypothetical protein